MGSARKLAGALMIVLDVDLPEGALLSKPDISEDRLGGLRFSAKELDRSHAHSLVPMPGGPTALPVEGNTDGCPVGTFGQVRFLAFESNRACGFQTEVPIQMRSTSIAVFFWSPDGDPQTLAALCPPEDRNYLHLTVRGGIASFGYRDADSDVSIDIPDLVRAPTLLMASAKADALTIGTHVGAPVSRSAPAFPEGPLNLYIGCRRFRSGLKNSLGCARIADVVFYPDLDLFAPEASALRNRLSDHLDVLSNAI